MVRKSEPVITITYYVIKPEKRSIIDKAFRLHFLTYFCFIAIIKIFTNNFIYYWIFQYSICISTLYLL